MAHRGVNIALSVDHEKRLLALAANPEGLIHFVTEELDEQTSDDWRCDIDKAWYAIALCLGEVEPFGKDDLYPGDGWFVGYSPTDYVKKSAEAVNTVNEATLRDCYFAIDEDEHDFSCSNENFAYTWSHYQRFANFLSKAAEAGRAAVFSVDY